MKIQRKLRDASKKAESYSRAVVRFLDSNWFLYIIIGLFVGQALWIAFSFRYPMIYDEARHVPIVDFFAQHISPFVGSQPTEYDSLGSLDITTGFTSSLYHYLMSYPYRLFALFTDTMDVKVMALRALNVGFVAAGLFLYAKVFRTAGIKRARYTNLGLLIFTMIPLVPFIAAHVNYDNLLFPLTALFFLASNRLMKEKINWRNVATVIVVGCLATLIKYTFLPVFAISIICVAVAVYLRERRFAVIWKGIKNSIKDSKKLELGVGLAAILVIGGLFTFTYTRNLIEYRTPRPKCEQILSIERCNSNPVAKRNLDAKATANTRPLMPISKYTTVWYENMINFTTMTGATLPDGSVILNRQIPTMNQLVYFGAILSVLVIINTWRTQKYRSAVWFLAANAAFLTATVFVNNYLIYRNFHLVFATQPRYVLSIVPIVLVLAVIGTGYIARKWPLSLKIVGLVIVLLITTQGGGAITHVLKSGPSWYWENQYAVEANGLAKKVLAPLVLEN